MNIFSVEGGKSQDPRFESMGFEVANLMVNILDMVILVILVAILLIGLILAYLCTKSKKE
jgi:hypothetical protein